MSETLVLVLGLISLGYLIKKTSHFPDNAADVLNSFVLNISLPAIIIISISKLTLNGDMIFPIVTHWVLFIIHILLLFLLNKVFKFSKSVLGVLLIVTTLGNTAFLGIPMVQGFFGQEGVSYAILYDQLGSGIAYIIIGSFVLPYFNGQGKRTIGEILKGMLVFPPLIGLVLGFVFKIIPMPSAVDSLLTNLSSALIPCAMVAVGMQVKFRMDVEKIKPLFIGLSVKLLLIPLIALVIAKSFFAKNFALDISIIQAGMPPMVTAGAMAMSANIEKELAAAFVGFGLILSFATLSLFHNFL